MAKRHYIPITSDVPGVSDSKCAFIRKVIRTALAAEGVDFPCEIDVRLTDDAVPGSGLGPRGEMGISREHVAAQAKEYGHSNRRELAYLVTHSVLHLLGYDHLDEGPMKAQMREHEEAIMKLLELER